MLIDSALPELKQRLSAHPIVLLQAPPGAGKSTVAPPALLNEDWLRGQRILMLEPRRLAARAVAARMAQLCGETPGQTIGYRVRFESAVSTNTRLEVLTEGILTRRLQNDPALDGVGLVIFDEFHERSLHADLALALCRDAQTVLRPDLRLLVMSATLDGDALSALLDNAPVVSAAGRPFPVELRYTERDTAAPIPVLVANAVANAVSQAIDEQPGDILAFLPGAGEIRRAHDLLAERHPGVAICPLYGDLPLDAQQTAILPDRAGRRKLVLSTSIAETSLTIEGVRAVVDSGYARVPRFDPRTGLTRLETARVTLDAADQRAGRAGRLGPGVCYRLWSAQTHRTLIPARTPEITEADLAPLRLEMAHWGARTAGDLRWITPPPAGALAQATTLLQLLGALDDSAHITARGRQLLDWGTHPRLAHMLSEAQSGKARDAKGAALAADVAALVDERDPMPDEAGADLTLRVEALRHWRSTPSRGGAFARFARLARIERLAAQWRKALRVPVDNTPPNPYDVGRCVALAYPDRIAQRRGDGVGRYRLASGGVRLMENDALQACEWLAVAHAQADAGQQAEGRIFLAAPLHPQDLEPFIAEREVVGWDTRQGALIAQRERRVGELLLSTRPLPQPPREKRIAALLEVLCREGLGLLRWTDEARQWQARAQSLHVWCGDPWPDVSDEALLARMARADTDMWPGPWLEGVTKRADFAALDVLEMLQALLPRTLRAQLATLAPERLEVPSGSKIRLQYALDGAPPVLAVKVQELFGLADTPAVNDGRTRVLLHLLSPAQRPIQVTQDLRSFWHNTYPEIRKELRGRYNKHPWPEDPWNATPTRKTVRASK